MRFIDNAFERAYLKQLHMLKEDADKPETDVDVDVDTTETEQENPVKQVCFKTSDPDLIDALNSGFEEVVFFVKATDEDGKDTVEEVKFKADSFGDVTVTDEECEDCCPECGNDPCTCDSEEDEDINLDEECNLNKESTEAESAPNSEQTEQQQMQDAQGAGAEQEQNK